MESEAVIEVSADQLKEAAGQVIVPKHDEDDLEEEMSEAAPLPAAPVRAEPASEDDDDEALDE
jgi:hypothetical protein